MAMHVQLYIYMHIYTYPIPAALVGQDDQRAAQRRTFRLRGQQQPGGANGSALPRLLARQPPGQHEPALSVPFV